MGTITHRPQRLNGPFRVHTLLEQLRSQTPEHLAKRLRDAETQYTESSREALASESTLTTSKERLSMMGDEVDKLEARKKEAEETSKNSISEIEQIKADSVGWVIELDELKEAHSQVSEEHRELDVLRTSHFEERATLKAQVVVLDVRRRARAGIVQRTEVSSTVSFCLTLFRY